MCGSEVTLNWTHVGVRFVAYWVGYWVGSRKQQLIESN